LSAKLRQLLPDNREIGADQAYAGLGLAELAPGNRPYVIANMVSSADGNATLEGKSSGISSDIDRQLFHTLRTQVDAVMAGTRTIGLERYGPLSPNPQRRARRTELGLAERPSAITVTRTLDLPLDAPLFADPGSKVFVITNCELPVPECPAEVIVLRTPGEAVDFGAAFETLCTDHGVRSILLEGGPTVLGMILSVGLLDELFLTVSPLIAGGGPGPTIVEAAPLPRPAALILKSAIAADSSLFLRYAVEHG